ncbi:MAG: hypothetical protein ABIH23_15495 [bacterium]
MSKVEVIEECGGQCSHFSHAETTYAPFYCMKENREIKLSDFLDDRRFPSWCSLDDAEEGEKDAGE